MEVVLGASVPDRRKPKQLGNRYLVPSTSYSGVNERRFQMGDVSPTVSVTSGVDHIGLTVGDLRASLAFFTNCLGWKLFGEKPDYPAAFVTDGHLKVTLWQVKDQTKYQAFDRRHNVGLHHLALKVLTLDDLYQLHERIRKWPSVTTEFSPEPSGAGPKIHFMINEPGGCRIEFSWDPR